MRIILELLRIILLYVILGGFLGRLLEELYTQFGFNTEKYGWSAGIAIFLLFFILYRNKLQFSGWCKGEGRKKLPKKVTQLLIILSVILLLLPPLLNLFNEI